MGLLMVLPMDTTKDIMPENKKEDNYYVSGEPEFIGKIPVKQELTVIPADNNGKATLGFYCRECRNLSG